METTVGIWSETYDSSYVADTNLQPGSQVTISVLIRNAPSFDAYVITLECNPYVVTF